MALVIGHKGAPSAAGENRVAGFEAARALGADGVELDVRRSAGGGLVVWHDPSLPDGTRLLDTAPDQLDGAVDGLDAVLDAAAGMRLVNVEIKNWPTDDDFDASLCIAGNVAELLAARPPAERARLVVSCFHPETLVHARRKLDELTPEIATGQLLWFVPGVEAVVREAAETGHLAIHPHHSGVTPELVDAAHQAGLNVNTWTCNDTDRIRWLASIGVDGIITDDPAAARRALGPDGRTSPRPGP